MWIDLRSDTVTLPTPAMKQAMLNAPLGDDVYGEDPSVNALQEYAAELFGMEAALFCPSGTMTNQIALRLHLQPGDEVICDRLAHIYNYECGGIALNAHASVRLIDSINGKITPEQIAANINPSDVHYPITRLVALENTLNKAGGICYKVKEIEPIVQLCRQRGLALHLDGARLFNALVANGEQPSQYGQLFDTISVCLSKGLGAPVGSLLLGKKEHIHKARRIRKAMGGGMRQAGMLAAAGLYALKHHVTRLAEDHHRAAKIAHLLAQCDYVSEILPVETNIIVFKLHSQRYQPEVFCQLLKQRGILANPFAGGVRFVTHLGFDDLQLEKVLNVLKVLENEHLA
ncbi:MAG: low-specificity L-threonine aldolase [Cytophagales bacterium]|nr:low-specificity L-threonine aldolase [Bernardetiaceae bacterium]MDW8211710.1 low-specificity L-threonine aldolase [Cytophagales bacterium]